MKRNSLLLAACFVFAGSTSGARAQEIPRADDAGSHVTANDRSDPFEPANRRIYGVSNFLDRQLFRPAAMTYRRVLPRPIRSGAHNFVSNLDEPSIAINDLLQGKLKRAGTSTMRFATNTTFGVAGLFDVAAKAGLLKHDNDFGITMGKWRLKSGPYLYIPLAGPSSVRDLTGIGVDFFLDPLGWVSFHGSDAIFATETVVGALDARVRADRALKDFKAISVDPYASMRSAYLQSREDKVQDGKINIDALPDFPDDTQPGPTVPGEVSTGGAVPETGFPGSK